MQMLELLSTYCTKTTFIIYLAMSCLPVWATIFACRKLAGNEELNQKYWVFARSDYKNWGYFKCALFNLALMFPIRYSVAWICVFSFTTIVLILMLGHV